MDAPDVLVVLADDDEPSVLGARLRFELHLDVSRAEAFAQVDRGSVREDAEPFPAAFDVRDDLGERHPLSCSVLRSHRYVSDPLIGFGWLGRPPRPT